MKRKPIGRPRETMLEKRDGKRGIIAFDELTDANRQLQSCIYRVILDRQIGDYTLPRGWWPVAAGNRREDRAAAQSLSTALANRFVHVHVRADWECWHAWANLNGISPNMDVCKAVSQCC